MAKVNSEVRMQLGRLNREEANAVQYLVGLLIARTCSPSSDLDEEIARVKQQLRDYIDHNAPLPALPSASLRH